MELFFRFKARRLIAEGQYNLYPTTKNDKCTYITVKGVYDGPIYTIKVKANISVKTTSGEKMSITDIQVGDEILLDYWGKWKGAETPLTAKWIKFMPENTGE